MVAPVSVAEAERRGRLITWRAFLQMRILRGALTVKKQILHSAQDDIGRCPHEPAKFFCCIARPGSSVVEERTEKTRGPVRAPRFALPHWLVPTTYDHIGRHRPANIAAKVACAR